MGIYIPGMEMPTNCEDCPMCHSNAEYDYAYCCVSSAETSGNKIPSECPLVPVPPHGRLIDADAFEAFIRKDWDKNDHWIADVVYSRPTIIPADKEGDVLNRRMA